MVGGSLFLLTIVIGVRKRVLGGGGKGVLRIIYVIILAVR